MRLPTFTNNYDGDKMRELVRQLEFALQRLAEADAGGGGSSSGLSDNPALPLGTAASGTSASGSRSDHVHPLPSASQVGADPAGSATNAINAHLDQPNPHPQYALEGDFFPFSPKSVGDVVIPENYNMLVGRNGLIVDGEITINGTLEVVDKE